MKFSIENNQVMDSGGVRRQVFCNVFKSIAHEHLKLFEGPLERLRPVVKPSNEVSGLLKNFGKAVAHSLLMNQIGFPDLSPPIYHYLIGKDDIAVTLLSDADTNGEAAYVVSKVCHCHVHVHCYTRKDRLYKISN